jgi:hypothetical protein
MDWSFTASNVARDYFRNRHLGKRGYGLTERNLTEAEPFVSDSHSASMVRIERDIQERFIWIARISRPNVRHNPQDSGKQWQAPGQD